MVQFNARLGRLRIQADLRALVAGALLLALLLTLGFWQLSRAAEKSALQARWMARSELPAVAPDVLLSEPDQSQHADRLLSWRGRFTPGYYLLLDNRIHQGRVGYHVIALASAGDLLVPVNLGWIAGDPARRTVPEPVVASGEIDIKGRVYVPTAPTLMLVEQVAPETLPALVQTLYWEDWQRRLSALAEAPLFPYEVRIDPVSPLAFSAEWSVVNQSNATHIGYALQWFAMALVLLIIAVVRITNVTELLRARRK